MNITNKNINGGKPFDWGRTSQEYAKYRDIYPQQFFDKIISRGLCISGQKVLDIGTGTGVIPRNMYKYGAEWTGADISAEQISQAKRLSKLQDMNIDYIVSPSEEISFGDNTFDVVTACQCFWYFDHKVLAPKLSRMLKRGGKLVSLRGLPNREFAVRMGMSAFKRMLFGFAGKKYDRIAAAKDQSYYFVFVHEDGAGLSRLPELFGNKKIEASVDEIYNLEDVNKALEKVASGGSKGKTILRIP